jgi:hypothetical protein
MTIFSRGSRRRSDVVRRIAPWVGGWLALQAVGVLAGRLLARRVDEGDESTAGIRRLRVMDEVKLRPHNPALARVRLDLVMAGGELDLTGVPRVPGGVDLTVNAVMGGMSVRVPRDWRVWVSSRGLGGVGTDAALTRTDDDRFADLRVHATVAMGGLGLEAAEPRVGTPV